MARLPSCADDGWMGISYAVVWREGDLPQGAGKLELLHDALRLDGVSGIDQTVKDVAYDDILGMRVGRTAGDRVAGRPSLVLDRRSAPPIRIASFGQPNVVSEVAERLAALQLGGEATQQTAVVLPLEEGWLDAARELLKRGPPFDPERIGLDRHQVFLTPSEVVLIFEARVGAPALEALLSDPVVLTEAAAWRDLLAGPPRIAESAYAWSRADGSPSHAKNGSWSYDF
jgi:hypothetical protein